MWRGRHEREPVRRGVGGRWQEGGEQALMEAMLGRSGADEPVLGRPRACQAGFRDSTPRLGRCAWLRFRLLERPQAENQHSLPLYPPAWEERAIRARASLPCPRCEGVGYEGRESLSVRALAGPPVVRPGSGWQVGHTAWTRRSGYIHQQPTGGRHHEAADVGVVMATLTSCVGGRRGRITALPESRIP